MQNAIARILDFYGLTAARAEETRGGWSAAAYRVESAQGPYFLKVYDRSLPSVRPWTDRIVCYLPALIYLNKKTPLAGRIACPVAAPDGRYVYMDEEYICLLFDYIPGETVRERPLTHAETIELAGITAILHEYSEEIPADTSRLAEDISLSFCTKLQNYLLEPNAPDVLEGALAPHRDMLLRLCAETLALREAVRAPAGKLSLCHTDMHNFNIMKAERLFLIDWEGLCLAPPEADLFMLTDNPYWDDFLTAYAKARPGFALNQDMLRFYHLRRQAEDLWADIERLLYDQPSEEVARRTREVAMRVISNAYRYMN